VKIKKWDHDVLLGDLDKTRKSLNDNSQLIQIIYLLLCASQKTVLYFPEF